LFGLVRGRHAASNSFRDHGASKWWRGMPNHVAIAIVQHAGMPGELHRVVVVGVVVVFGHVRRRQAVANPLGRAEFGLRRRGLPDPASEPAL